jgi:hypothetical protein
VKGENEANFKEPRKVEGSWKDGSEVQETDQNRRI